MTRNPSNRGKQLTPRSQSNPKRPSPEIRKILQTSRIHIVDWTLQVGFQHKHSHFYQVNHCIRLMSNNHNNHSHITLATAPLAIQLLTPMQHSMIPMVYHRYQTMWIQTQTIGNLNTSICKFSFHTTSFSSSINFNSTIPVFIRVWNPNTNTSTEPWGPSLQDFPPAYGDNMGMRPPETFCRSWRTDISTTRNDKLSWPGYAAVPRPTLCSGRRVQRSSQ